MRHYTRNGILLLDESWLAEMMKGSTVAAVKPSNQKPLPSRKGDALARYSDS